MRQLGLRLAALALALQHAGMDQAQGRLLVVLLAIVLSSLLDAQLECEIGGVIVPEHSSVHFRLLLPAANSFGVKLSAGGANASSRYSVRRGPPPRRRSPAGHPAEAESR